MPYDATKMADWQISEAAEKKMPTPEEWREKLGLQKDEILPMGRLAKLDFLKIIERLKDKPDGKYIEVTAITPTPLGEGKSTTSVGLIEGLGKRGKNVGGCLRQPSGGPTMNVKGTAAGGGNALLIPMTEFSLGLTGDINDIMNAHNLAMVALTARMQHERNYNDEQLAAPDQDAPPRHRSHPGGDGLDHGLLRPGAAQHHHRHRRPQRRLHDAVQVRHRGQLRAAWPSSPSSRTWPTCKKRLNEITVAFDKSGKPVTTGDLEVGSAMTRLDAQHHQSDPHEHGRVPALHGARRALRQHRRRPVLDHRRPHRPEDVRLPRDRERLRGRHRLREVLEREVPLQRPQAPRLGADRHHPRPQDARRRAQGRRRHGPARGVHEGEPAPWWKRAAPTWSTIINIIRKSGINPVVCINRFHTDTDD